MVTYFFDSYALIAIIRNSPNYLKYSEEAIATAKFNLAELIYIIMVELGEESAKTAFDKFKDSEVQIAHEVLFKAMKFRHKNKKKGLSYADSIGYIFALENDLKFLTGDDAFKDMDNVEFVK